MNYEFDLGVSRARWNRPDNPCRKRQNTGSRERGRNRVSEMADPAVLILI
jgi:hypothetical protein